MPNFAVSQRCFDAAGFGLLLFGGQLCDQRRAFFLSQKAGLLRAIVEIEKAKTPRATAGNPSSTNIQNQPGLPSTPCISSNAPDSGEPSVRAAGTPSTKMPMTEARTLLGK